MSRTEAYTLMLTTLKNTITVIETCARASRNVAARKLAQRHLERINEAIKAAEEAQ